MGAAASSMPSRQDNPLAGRRV